MPKMSKTDELRERLAIEMDHVKARMLELKARARKLGLEARLDYEKGLRALETKERELKARMKDWAKAGEKAGTEMKKGVELAAKDLKKAVEDAWARLK
jgi:hypothetical protein